MGGGGVAGGIPIPHQLNTIFKIILIRFEMILNTIENDLKNILKLIKIRSLNHFRLIIYIHSKLRHKMLNGESSHHWCPGDKLKRSYGPAWTRRSLDIDFI